MAVKPKSADNYVEHFKKGK